MTNAPNRIKDIFLGSLPASLAAKGAATNPPIINARMVCQWLTPIMVKKVKALARVTKNSVKLTEPTTYL